MNNDVDGGPVVEAHGWSGIMVQSGGGGMCKSKWPENLVKVGVKINSLWRWWS